jgi:two-component system cell cycle response regulator CtrA
MSDGSRDIDEAYVKAVEAENMELREKVYALETIVGFRIEIPAILGLTASEEKVLGFLTKREIATKEHIMMALYADRPNMEPELKIVDVFICKIRNKVKKFDIDIRTEWGRGYSLTPASKAIIKQMLTPEPVE